METQTVIDRICKNTNKCAFTKKEKKKKEKRKKKEANKQINTQAKKEKWLCIFYVNFSSKFSMCYCLPPLKVRTSY